jgi:hypothetical protein
LNDGRHIDDPEPRQRHDVHRPHGPTAIAEGGWFQSERSTWNQAAGASRRAELGQTLTEPSRLLIHHQKESTYRAAVHGRTTHPVSCGRRRPWSAPPGMEREMAGGGPRPENLCEPLNLSEERGSNVATHPCPHLNKHQQTTRGNTLLCASEVSAKTVESRTLRVSQLFGGPRSYLHVFHTYV